MENSPVLDAYGTPDCWESGLGPFAIARRDGADGVGFAVFLVDVFNLGVKNALWKPSSLGKFHDVVQEIGQRQGMEPIAPEALAKIVRGAVDYASSQGFKPHADYRAASHQLDELDIYAWQTKLSYGKNGKPFYVRGPHETLAEASAVSRKTAELGGQKVIRIGQSDLDEIESAALLVEEGSPCLAARKADATACRPPGQAGSGGVSAMSK